ncbi:MAG: hypothetical protein ACE5KZ_11575 [Candidatus Scalinduaceae bacterium]
MTLGVALEEVRGGCEDKAMNTKKQQKNDYRIFRIDNKLFIPEVIFLIGNGAIENGNVPLDEYYTNNSDETRDSAR